jgi:hypothetical protein
MRKMNKNIFFVQKNTENVSDFSVGVRPFCQLAVLPISLNVAFIYITSGVDQRMFLTKFNPERLNNQCDSEIEQLHEKVS